MCVPAQTGEGVTLIVLPVQRLLTLFKGYENEQISDSGSIEEHRW